jgi:hypothetical protein
VSGLLDRGFAAGYIISDGTFLPGAHKPLITESEWESYLARRRATRWQKRTERESFLLDGLLTCRCGTLMTPETATPPGKPKYRCRAHGMLGKSSTVNQDRIDPLVHQWLTSLASDPNVMARARAASSRWADEQWVESRRLAADLANGASSASPDLAQNIAAAQTNSARVDPVRLAEGLLADWGVLNNPQRQDRLRALVHGFTADNTYTTPVLAVLTTWGSFERFAGYLRMRYSAAPEQTRSESESVLPPDATQWLTSIETARLLGVCLATLTKWRQLDLLPGAKNASGSYMYPLVQVRQIEQAPRRTSGIDRKALRFLRSANQVTGDVPDPEPRSVGFAAQPDRRSTSSNTSVGSVPNRRE